MKIIIKGKYCSHCGESDCKHSKPNKLAKLEYFPVWQERTCSIKEFNQRFGKQEGLWESKGGEHKETKCDNINCHCINGKHCRRRMDDKKFWCIDFKSLSELQHFFDEVGFCKIYTEEQDGCCLTIDLD
jgi:hypothetical protein